MNQLVQSIETAGAIQGILLSFFLYFKRKHPATRFLGTYLFVFSLGLLEPQLERLALHPILRACFTLTSSNFLYGPLLYLFVASLVERPSQRQRLYVLHFLPFVLDAGVNIWHLAQPHAYEEIFGVLELIGFELLVVQVLTYNLLAVRKLHRCRQLIETADAAVAANGLRWLQHFLFLLTGIYMLSFVLTHLIIFDFTQNRELYILVQGGIVFAVYLMSYRIILQPQSFLLHPAGSPEKSLEPGKRYRKSGLKEEQATMYLEHLIAYMQKGKPYRNPDLSIHTVALALNISKNHLTQIINEKLGKNFFEFVNAFRVEEVKTLLQHPEAHRLTLSAIGGQAGFQSKAAFYSNFKKYTGKTPLEWKKESEKTLQQTSANTLPAKKIANS